MPYPKPIQLPVSPGCFWVAKYCLKKRHSYVHWLHYKRILSNLSCLLSATWQFFHSSPACFLSHPQQLVHSFVTFPVAPTSPSTSTLLHQERRLTVRQEFLTPPPPLPQNGLKYVRPPFPPFFPLRRAVLPSPGHPAISLLSYPTLSKILTPIY